MAERIVYTLFGAFLVVAAIVINNNTSFVRASDVVSSPKIEVADQPIKTQSRFTIKITEETAKIASKTIYQDDPETEAGEEKVLDEGADGKKTTITKITYYKTDTSGVGLLVPSVVEGDSPEVDQGQEYSREIVGTEVTEPKDKIISRGTKIIWKTIQTEQGEIRYWKKMRVWATHYDSHCPGCNEWTSIGMKQGKGIIAVDPTIIKYRTKVYVPGYGMAIAGDTGGAIKGNIIDLGFEDAKTAGWYAHFVDIYLID